MRTIVVGYGTQGHKRVRAAGSDHRGIVDPVRSEADFRHLKDVPLENYDAALVCLPDSLKFETLHYLLSHRKHAMVEKPLLDLTHHQIEELMGLSRKNEVVCYTAYNHRFEPHFVAMKNILDSGRLGRVYHVRMFYGNGTARDVRQSPWKDQGWAVFGDLGSHLLDTALFWFGETQATWKPIQFHRFENQAYDHVLFGTDQVSSGPSFIFETTLLQWKNNFYCDVFAEKGSAHIECLCKWGPSRLSVRTRVLPSGRPPEETTILEKSDPTWDLEYAYFKTLCESSDLKLKSNLKNDLWINSRLREVSEQIGKVKS